MRGELPQFKRCCICLPLRLGLIVWGYIRLVIGVLLLVLVSKGFFELLEKSKSESGYIIFVVLLGFFVILAGTDIVLNIAFVIAGHTKDLKMLKAYYIYSFILWILMIIMGVCLTLYGALVLKWYATDFLRVWMVVCDITTFLAQIVVQAYILLLVRSELIKLTNNCEFRFVNNAAESACNMKCEQDNRDTESFNDNPDYNVYEDFKAKENYKANEDGTANGYKVRIYKHESSEFTDTY